MANKEDQIIFSWLHFSDIHFCHGEQKERLDQEMVLQALLKELSTKENIKHLDIPSPDAIFITGDIVHSGGISDNNEFEVAKGWIDKICETVKLPKNDVFIVPGNHDVQRDFYNEDDDIAMLLDNLREDRRELDWALNKKNQLKRLKRRFSNFTNFVQNYAPVWGSQKAKNLFWKHDLTLPMGFIIKILGINTAILSQDDNDYRPRYLEAQK